MDQYPIRRSKTCRSRRPPHRPLAEYWGIPEARAAAVRAQTRTGRAFGVRACATCRHYHIAPAFQACAACPSGDGKPKHLYPTLAEAKEAAAMCGGRLRVYPCPNGGRGFHLTKSWG